MPRPRLVILGYSEAAMYLRGASGGEVGALISIHGPREFGVEAAVSRKLDLTFDDVEVPVPGDVLSMQRAMGRRRWAEQTGLTEVAPTRDDVEAIVRFAESIRDDAGTLLCHCAGGMSRAPAAAFICLAVWLGTGRERECAAEVKRIRPGAVPHIGVVRFADELLSRGGELVRAVSADWSSVTSG
jgi:predicted protein tyrosine phosphatase